MNRMTMMKVHALLAAFVLPVACMFIITGALYTWGVTGGYVNDRYDIQLSEPLEANLIELTALAEGEIEKRGLDNPTGKAKVKVSGAHFRLEWTGSTMDVVVEPTSNPNVAKLTVKNASWYRNFVQLHKAKGGVLFKIYAAILSLSILVILLSGFVMALNTPTLRKMSIVTLLLGFGSFVVLVLLS